MKHSKHLPRRTFLQERFEILISRQKRGIATFAELTELDELVNRNIIIRDQVLEEMQQADLPGDDVDEQVELYPVGHQSHGLLSMLLAWLHRFFLKSNVVQKILVY